LKAEPASGQPAVHETAAAFVPKTLTSDFLKGRASVAQLADGSHVIAWDGETRIGQLKPKGWSDDFVLTYKVAGYTPDPKATCNWASPLDASGGRSRPPRREGGSNLTRDPLQGLHRLASRQGDHEGLSTVGGDGQSRIERHGAEERNPRVGGELRGIG